MGLFYKTGQGFDDTISIVVRYYLYIYLKGIRTQMLIVTRPAARIGMGHRMDRRHIILIDGIPLTTPRIRVIGVPMP